MNRIPKRTIFYQSVLQWLTDWLPALPLLVVAYGLLVAPIAMLIVQSVLADDGSFTLTHWITILTSRSNQTAITTSLSLGLISATISLIVGGPIAWFISRMLPLHRSLWLAILNTATNFGGIGLAFGFVAILGTYGMVTLFLQQLAIPFQPPASGSVLGLAIAYAYVNIPLFILLVIPGMGSLRQEWWEAAQISGATQWQFWRSVGLPILMPFLGAGWVLVFTWSIGLYGLPLALGSGVSRNVLLITLQIGDTLRASISGQGEAAVLATILFVLACIGLATYRCILRRAARWL